MSTEGYRVQKIEKMPEIITVEGESNVSPFPVRHWEEPLPIAVEGRELPKREESHEAKNVVSRFYPPLLLSSLLLTGVFLYLYVLLFQRRIPFLERNRFSLMLRSWLHP